MIKDFVIPQKIDKQQSLVLKKESDFKCKISDFLISNTCFCFWLYGSKKCEFMPNFNKKSWTFSSHHIPDSTDGRAKLLMGFSPVEKCVYDVIKVSIIKTCGLFCMQHNIIYEEAHRSVDRWVFGHICNIKDQLWTGLGSWASTEKNESDYEQQLRAFFFFMFQYSKK